MIWISKKFSIRTLKLLYCQKQEQEQNFDPACDLKVDSNFKIVMPLPVIYEFVYFVCQITE